MKIGSCYSGGIDGFAYAAGQLAMDVSWHIESDYRAWKYLKQNYGAGKIYKHDELARNLEWVNIICGGEPCQPHSNSGLNLGPEDNRYRWPYMFNIIRTVRPDWIINENVTGSISNMVLDKKISDLESIGYTCQAFVIPAVATNAHHERKRVWLVANANGERRGELVPADFGNRIKQGAASKYSLGALGNPFLQFEQRHAEPAIFPMVDGIPDHIFRLQAAGNAVVSTIPLILLSAIKFIEENA